MVARWPDEDFACERCGLDYADLTVRGAFEIISSVPDTAGVVAGGLSEQAIRLRSTPGVWSVLEYLYHLRDVYETYTIRLHRSRTEEKPRLDPMFNDLRAERFRYNQLPSTAVFAELTAAVAGILDEAAALSPDDWTRTVSRQAGEERTALWLVRQAAHEGRHHLADIRDTAARVA